MGKTIIQTIGPLYGEVENGTVFGRPNGSIYVPSTNTITITIPAGRDYVRTATYAYGDRIQICNSSGSSVGMTFRIVAEAQDIQSAISTHLEDEDGVMIGTPITLQAGQFNVDRSFVGIGGEGVTIQANAKYYLVAELLSNSGVPVASNKVEVTGVVVE
jgi:hypothetical protein